MSEQQLENNENRDLSVGQYDGLYLTAVVYKHKWYIIIFSFLSMVAIAIMSLYMPNWYAATANVVPPQTSESGLESMMGGISSALKEFGLTSLKGQQGGYAFIVMLESRTVKDSMIKHFNLAEEYDIPDTNWTQLRKTFDGNLNISYEKEGNYFITLYSKDPNKAAEMANEYVKIANEFAMRVFREETSHNRQFMEQRLLSIDSTINIITDSLNYISRKYGIVHPLEQAKAVSMALSNLKAEEIKFGILYDYNKSNYGELDPMSIQFKTLRDKTKAQMENVFKESGFAGNFALQDAANIGYNYAKLYAEFEAFATIKSFLAPTLEKTRLDEQKNLKTLIFVDYAVPPDKKAKPKRSFLVLGAGIGTFVISVIFILLLNGFKNFKKKYKKLISN